MRDRSIHRLLLAATCLAAAALCAPAAAREPVVLQLKWFNQFQFAGYYAAREKGFYAEEGLDVEIRERRPPENHIQAVLDGAAHYGVSDTSLVLHRLRGRPLVILAAVYQHSPLVLVTRSEDGILGPQELIGKRVMRQYGVDDAALTAMFHRLGIDGEQLVEQPHSFDDDALIRDETDAISAYSTNQPFYYRQQGLDVRIIDPANYGIDFYGDMLFTSERELHQYPERAVRFRRASLRGWQYALDNPDEVIDWLIERYGVDRPRERLRHEAAEIRRMIRPDLVELGSFDEGRLQRIATIYRELQMAPAETTITGLDYRHHLYDSHPLPDWLAPLAVLALAALLGLYAVNRRLQTLVRRRTAELACANETLGRYLAIVDRHVITSQTDARGIITSASEAFCRISGFSRQELLGQPHRIVRHPDMPASIYRELWGCLRQGRSWHGELKNRAKDGTAYWVQVNIDPIFEQGRITGYTAIRHDITDRKRVEELMRTDRLTGLFNRHELDHALEVETSRAGRHDVPLSVLLADVDHFKQVNDRYGHLAGDRVLKTLAGVLRGMIRPTDIVGRWGGEEFLIICPHTDAAGVHKLAERIRGAMEQTVTEPGGSHTCSFGVATWRPDEATEKLLGRADAALYRAKEQGRNRVESAA